MLMKNHRLLHLWRMGLVFLLAICISVVSVTSAQDLFKNAYSHYSDNEPIPSVLSDFARAQGLTPVVSPQIQGVLSGRFANVDPVTFLNGLRSAFGVRYYVQDQTIYFYHDSESARSMFKPASGNAQHLLSQLQQAKVLASSLPVSVSRDGLLIIEGPTQYVSQVVATAQQLDQSDDFKPVIKVFRLKHAKAEDIQVQSSDRTVVIPGIASILQSMVGNANSLSRSKVSVTQNSAVVPGLRGTGMAATANNAASTKGNTIGDNVNAWLGGATGLSSAKSDPDMRPGNEDSGVTYQPTIIADSRLNAVIIQDAQYRMSYYSQVIQELDVPVKLIELHAAIVDVDVDSSRSLGVDWNAARRSGNWGFGVSSGNLNWNGALPAPTTNGGVFSTVFETGHSSVMMQINALEENNKARTLGKPSVLTMDNIEATLEDTTTRYVPVSGYQDSDLFKVESGTVLRVTPHIVEGTDGSLPLIQMQITLQSNQDNTSDYNIVDSEGNLQLPPIKQTKLNTQAVVREGQSLLIGGYFVQYSKGGDTGVPTLKDAPVVGGLFSSDSENTYTRERLLIITPRILSLDDINVPSHADYSEFTRSPTSTTYEPRPVVAADTEERSGCSSSRNASPNQAQSQDQVQPGQVQGQGQAQGQLISGQGQGQVGAVQAGQAQADGLSPVPAGSKGNLSVDAVPNYRVVYTGQSSGSATPQVIPQIGAN